jgi:hypothetical protein
LSCCEVVLLWDWNAAWRLWAAEVANFIFTAITELSGLARFRLSCANFLLDFSSARSLSRSQAQVGQEGKESGVAEEAEKAEKGERRLERRSKRRSKRRRKEEVEEKVEGEDGQEKAGRRRRKEKVEKVEKMEYMELENDASAGLARLLN